MMYDWSEQRVRQAVENSSNYSDTLRYLGVPIAGNNITTLKRKIEKFNIDVSHFTGRNYVLNNDKYIPYDEYKNNEKKIKTYLLKKKLFKEGLKEEKCEICGIKEWMGKQIVFQIHHKDGDNKNNALDNLMILCPNCHSQTENFCKNTSIEKEVKTCPICGKPITKRSNYCSKCASENRKKVNLTKEQLENDLKELGTKVAVANKYGVSEATIRKKMKKFNIK